MARSRTATSPVEAAVEVIDVLVGEEDAANIPQTAEPNCGQPLLDGGAAAGHARGHERGAVDPVPEHRRPGGRRVAAHVHGQVQGLDAVADLHLYTGYRAPATLPRPALLGFRV